MSDNLEHVPCHENINWQYQVRERKITEFELRTNTCIWFPNKNLLMRTYLCTSSTHHYTKQVIVWWFVICFYGNQIKISVTTATNSSSVHASVGIKMSTPISHSIAYSIKLSLHDLKEAVFRLTYDLAPVPTCRLACNECKTLLW